MLVAECYDELYSSVDSIVTLAISVSSLRYRR